MVNSCPISGAISLTGTEVLHAKWHSHPFYFHCSGCSMDSSGETFPDLLFESGSRQPGSVILDGGEKPGDVCNLSVGHKSVNSEVNVPIIYAGYYFSDASERKWYENNPDGLFIHLS